MLNLSFRGISDSITTYTLYTIYVLICKNMYIHEHNIACLLSGVIAQTETHIYNALSLVETDLVGACRNRKLSII